MARKKKNKASLSVLKFIVIVGLTLGAAVFACVQTISWAKQSDYFTVQKIVIDPSLQFINKRDLVRFKGQSLFKVNIKEVEARLSRKYPQVSDIRVFREFPNQLRIGAKERIPFAQTNLSKKTLTIDERGIVLSTASKQDKNLPFIDGIDQNKQKANLGLPLKGTNVKAALKVIKAFKVNSSLDGYKIKDIDVQDLSKIELFLSNDLKVFVDRDKLERKMRNLSLVLQKSDIDFKDVRYLDLRFKEPVIGKK